MKSITTKNKRRNLRSNEAYDAKTAIVYVRCKPHYPIDIKKIKKAIQPQFLECSSFSRLQGYQVTGFECDIGRIGATNTISGLHKAIKAVDKNKATCIITQDINVLADNFEQAISLTEYFFFEKIICVHPNFITNFIKTRRGSL